MADRNCKKRMYISISSSSSQAEEESESESEIDDSDEEYHHDGEDCSASASSDDDASEWSDDKGDESENEKDDEHSDPDDDEFLCNKVIRLLRERSSLQDVSLADCKAYLRKHGLRVTGTKAECIQRIMEHWRIKDGNGEALYPRSSFTINCTGDVCQGDVVLFTQKVYEKFDKVTRRGSLSGKRVVAGRIVKESYGAAKQQHTFTVEVLWSKGMKKLPPLFPLLVKGRNLYRLKTFRQRWKNEAERSKVLDEKHQRGAAARLVRAMNMKRKSKSGNTERGAKRQKHTLHERPSQVKRTTTSEKRKRVTEHGRASKGHVKPNNLCQKAPSVQTTKFRDHNSSGRHQNRTYSNRTSGPTLQPSTYASQNLHKSQFYSDSSHRSAPYSFPGNEVGSTSAMRFPDFRPSYTNSYATNAPPRPLGPYHDIYPRPEYLHPSYQVEPRNFSRIPGVMNIQRPSHPFYGGNGKYGERNYRF